MDINKKSNNILCVANFASDVGYAWWLMENYWYNIAHFFSNKGVKTFLIYPKINNVPAIISNSTITLIEHDFSDKSKENKQKLKNIIKRNNIKYIYLSDRSFYSMYYFQLRCWGVKKIINHLHTSCPMDQISIFSLIIKKVIHFFRLFSCNYYITVSRYVEDKIVSIACVPKSVCGYIHNGIHPINEISTKEKELIRKKMGFLLSDIIIVVCARATYFKRLDFFVEMASVICKQLSERNIYFLHIGDGPEICKLKILAKNNGVEKSVIFTGKRLDVRDILPACDIAFHPSEREAFSLAILEYLSSGLPVIAADMCGNHEVIECDYNGYLFDYDNIDDLMHKFKNLIHNEELRDKLGHNAKNTVRSKFDINIANAKLISLLNKYFI